MSVYCHWRGDCDFRPPPARPLRPLQNSAVCVCVCRLHHSALTLTPTHRPLSTNSRCCWPRSQTQTVQSSRSLLSILLLLFVVLTGVLTRATEESHTLVLFNINININFSFNIGVGGGGGFLIIAAAGAAAWKSTQLGNR